MAKSALLKSSIVKKYWMALTGLFLCLFLAGHLAGNLQLIFGTSKQFNEYALFMTTNPAVKLLSYLTYISILFHAIDGIMLTIQNKKARPVGYAKTDGSSSSLASRNMAGRWSCMQRTERSPPSVRDWPRWPERTRRCWTPGG